MSTGPSLKSIWKPLPVCRLTACCVAVLAAVLTTCPYWTAAPTKAGTGTADIEAQLSEKTNLYIIPESVRWMTVPEAHGLASARAWYEIIFLAAQKKGAPSDLFRILVKTVDGKTVYAARDLKNLSSSPDGDEGELRADPPFVASATRALGRVRSISLFDFRAAASAEGPQSGLEKWMQRVTNLIETGHEAGIGRTTVRFASAPRSVEYELSKDTLRLRWTDAHGEVGTAEVRANSTSDAASKVIVTPTRRPTKRPVLWAVDTVRSLPFVGPGPIEWLEGRVFAVKDFVRRTNYQFFGDESTPLLDSPAETTAREQLNLPSGLEIGTPATGETWPPSPFDPPVFPRRAPGEGNWQPTGPVFLKRLENAPSAFYKSYVRPDKERPYVSVQLFAMDMRQLTLHMVGGIEDPQSTTGSAGDGRIPRQKALMERVVAAFNGAFKTEHGAYGMMVAENVLLPPKDDSATVATLKDGRALMGSWPKGMKIPDEMYSYRQNMDPLVENGVVNPKRRYLWGFTLGNDMTKMQTVRSGLCMSDKGYLIYAWGEDVTAQTLGIAMNAAGCSFGLHLDMNPYHTAFIYYAFSMNDNEERPHYEYQSAIPQTLYSPHRYINGAPKDFFFLSLKQTAPGPDWSQNGLAQTAPAFLPSVFRKNSTGCNMAAVHLDRTSAHLTPGNIPEYLAPAGHDPDNPAGKNQLLVDVDLGPWAETRGQIVADSVTAETPEGTPVLGVDKQGIPILFTWQKGVSTDVTDMLAGASFDKDTNPAAPVIGIGMRDDWFFIAEGGVASVRDALEGERVTKKMYFSVADTAKAPVRVYVRDEKGMTDLRGNRILETDTGSTHLQFSAQPRPLGVKRLESIFSPPSLITAKKDIQNGAN